MSATGNAIMRHLTEHDMEGRGPGLTAAELADAIGVALPMARRDLATLVFKDRVVTCDRAGRYRLGDPTPLLEFA